MDLEIHLSPVPLSPVLSCLLTCSITEILSIITFSMTQKRMRSLENTKNKCQECHHLISHTNVSGTRPHTKFTLSIDKVNHSESSLRRMITPKLLKLNKSRSAKLISEPCFWSKKHVSLLEVLATFCSSREFMTRKLKNGIGKNISNFNIKVFFTLSKVTSESTLPLMKKYSSTLLTTKNSPQSLKMSCITTCNAVVWSSEVKLDMVSLTRLTLKVSTSIRESTSTISKWMLLQKT